MISSLDDQQLSPMQSTSELGDSRKELRQTECCVHGRPCAIASRLSREKEKEASYHSSSGLHDSSIASGYKSISKKSEPHVHENVSYNLRKKVEREALDVPTRTWNFRASHLSPSITNSDPEIEEEGLQRIRNKERHTGRRVEGVCLSRTKDASSIEEEKKRVISNERYDGYEMMRPTTLAPPPTPTEEALWTARRHGSMDVSPSVEAYIGVMTAKKAEEYVVKPASFKLYHMMPKIESLNHVLPALGLYIIYRSGTGHVYHYPIRQRKQNVDDSKTRSKLSRLTNLQRQFKAVRVEYGDPMAPWFFTLDALVSYYNVYVHLHEVDGECVADIFPPNEIGHISKSYQHASSVFH
ncbi:unnamed protein product [Cercopithifilaria johnstoni]|uniref:Uncharacterized protein n=1 Tax=Cercopithifilaria johnstoni TaxID=2874296 RepID=A0A8J2MAP2_9BILA|nr:unnamed protein product [Cercopithifilaria johnstoni]